MEWENWLDKKVLDHGKQRKTDDFADPDKSLLLDTEPDKTIPQIKRDFDDETHEDPYSNKNDVNKIIGLIGAGAMTAYKKLKEPSSEDSSIEVQDSGVSSSDVNKILGALVGGAAKVVGEAAGKVGGAVKDVASNPVVQSAVSNTGDKVDDVVEDVKNENQTGVTKAWESWLDKNNGIETDHKKEDKHEWDGKFSSSTIRDDAENDDDKAVSEEESLEELTDGKLEEVEKLKSWEVFLDKMGEGGTSHATSIIPTEEEKEKRIFNKNPPKNVKSHFANPNKEKPAITGTKIIQTDRKGTFQDTKNTKNLTENDVTAGAVRTAKKHPELKQFIPEAQVEEDKGLGGDTDKPVKTQEELDKEFYERTQPEPKGTKSDKKVLARRMRKSWELFLEKGIKYKDPDPKETDPKKIMENAADPIKEITLTPDMKKKKSWEEWVEKMQGAGDARYGNQHLTGMEQHPVADDESMELSAETEENNEKQEEKEDKEDKDNKPYKALSQE